MKTYEVSIQSLVIQTVQVKANSEDEAYQLAKMQSAFETVKDNVVGLDITDNWVVEVSV